jgi:hypothetical protein
MRIHADAQSQLMRLASPVRQVGEDMREVDRLVYSLRAGHAQPVQSLAGRQPPYDGSCRQSGRSGSSRDTRAFLVLSPRNDKEISLDQRFRRFSDDRIGHFPVIPLSAASQSSHRRVFGDRLTAKP